MENFERIENKYRVPIDMLDNIRERILPYMEHDDYCVDVEGNRYPVCSVYLDTPDNRFYYEKHSGNMVRKKLRIRGYNEVGNDGIVFLEIKRKIENTIFKERTGIYFSDTVKLLNGANITPIDEQNPHAARTTLNRFVYLTKRLNLTPKTLITYDREAFLSKTDTELRVTFDVGVSSLPNPGINEIFRVDDNRTFTNDFFILEIKFNSATFPGWLHRVIRDYKLRLEAFSKYCNGIDAWSEDASGVQIHK
ncbi:MAG: polyphosphate polymerase domain-containing protein [Candidatus Electryonea clarkiae]|nr:polyphosphate polymerase domain-containing protein [Candidatus Electryonea clarkiae]MDP8288148.1 polyphosphate polymerase domain-containing protein [Candidatus Electryonea clarkiae]